MQMFLILLSHITPIETVDRLIGAHRQFLERHYTSGVFLLSGRKEPRTGGVILAKAKSRSEIEKIIEEDPFSIEKVATYTIIEFIPTMVAENLADLKGPF
jgi:uncharacterized protein YciI